MRGKLDNPTVDDDLRHYEFLCAKQLEQWPVKYLYDRLNIIDSKTSSLLRFNGVVIGFLSVLIFRVNEIGLDKVLLYAIIFATYIFLLLAEARSLQIFYLRFDRIRGSGASADEDFMRYKRTMLEITINREEYFRDALFATAWGIVGFTSIFVLAAYGLATR